MPRFHRKYRAGYWSSSKLSHWLRTKAGLDNPGALSCEGWAEHEKQSKATAPFINWVTDEFFDKMQRWVMFPSDCLYSVKVFYRNWKDKSHVLEGGFEVGQWIDRCTRFNTCLFYELEKFIEREKSYETLNWEIGLVYDEGWGYSPEDECYGKPTSQALAAMEQKRIIDWWKKNKDRDFFKESGLSDCYSFEHGDSFWESYSKMKDNPEQNACREKERELESKFKEEEEEMLIRLIKIRDTLWS